MNFNVDLKKMVRDAGTVVNRVVQMTGEKLGTSEKTELDAHFENLAERSDTTKIWTEKILKDTEAVLTPNPGNRVEDFLFEKIDKKRPNRLSNLEYLGQDMIDAGNEFGPGTSYGSSLLKVGQSEQKLGKIEREFISNVNSSFLLPLRKYLDGEMKTITNERSILESKRLDLDACKNRVRKARSMIGQPTCTPMRMHQKEGPSPEFLLQEAERDLRNAQSEFDRQVEITKLLLESVSSSHASHLRCLHDLVDAQLLYYQQCVSTVQELKNEISNERRSPVVRINSEEIDLMAPGNRSEHLSPKGGRKAERAKVVVQYEAKNSKEISLTLDEIVEIEKISEDEKDYVIAHRGDQSGRVPFAYLEVLP